MAALTPVQQYGRAVFKLRFGGKVGTCFMIDASRGLLWTAAHNFSNCYEPKIATSQTWQVACSAGNRPCARAFVGEMCDLGMADAPGGAVEYKFRAEVLQSSGANLHVPAGLPEWHNLDGALLVIRKRLVNGVEYALELDATTGAPVFHDVTGAPLPALPLAGAPPRFGEEPIVLLGYPVRGVSTVLTPTHGFVENKQTRSADDGEYLLTTAVMLQGHSGGPVINSTGEVVGWNVRHATLKEATTLPGYPTGSGPHVPVACGINEFRPVRSLVEQLQRWCSKSEALRRQVFGVPGVPGGMPGPPAAPVVPLDIPQHFAAQQYCLHVRMHEAQMAEDAKASADDAADAADQAGDAATAAKAREQAAAAHAKHAERMAKQAEAAAQRVEGGTVQVQAAAAAAESLKEAAEEAEAKAAGHAVAAAGEASKAKEAAQSMGHHFLRVASAEYAEHDAQRKRKEADYVAGQADEAEELARQKRQAVLTASAGDPSAGTSAMGSWSAGGSGVLGGAELFGAATSSSAQESSPGAKRHRANRAERVPSPTTTAPNEILVVISAPLVHKRAGQERPVPPLNQERELQGLTSSFGEANKALCLRAAFAQTDELLQMLTTHRPLLLHFSGHVQSESRIMVQCCRHTHHPVTPLVCVQGEPGSLMFEDGEGLGHRVANDKLRQLVAAGGASSLQLVFVAACHSEAAAKAFLDAGVPCVVAVALKERLHDAAAIRFAKQFYLDIALGSTTQQAFDKAKAAVNASAELQHSEHGDLSSREANKFQLYGSQEERNRSVLPSLAGANPPWMQGEPWFYALTSNCQLPAPFVLPEPFVGRTFDIRAVVVRVLQGRLVTVTGDAGIGKCAVAAAAARYLDERGHFRAGVQVLSVAEAEAWSPPQGQGGKLLLLVRCSEDQLSSEVLARLLNARGPGAPVKVHVLLTARKPLSCSTHVAEIPYVVKPLTKVDTEQLLRARCPARSLSPADLASIFLSTGGNPDSVRRQATSLCAGGAALEAPPLAELAPGATFLHIALHAPPVRPQLKALQRVELMRRLQQLRLRLEGSKSSNATRPVQLSDASVIHSSDASPMPLRVALAEGSIHGLVLCAAGYGWEDGDSVQLEEVAKHCGGERRPRVVVVCMCHGARRAAERLLCAGAPTVLWVTGDMFGTDAAALCTVLVRVLVRMEAEELTEAEDVVAKLRDECNDSAGLSEICFGCLRRSMAAGTQWQCTSESSTGNSWCQISAQPELLAADSTNLGGRVGASSGLLAIDVHHVSRMHAAFKGDDERLQCIHGKSERCTAIATELCRSFLDGKRFDIVWHVSNDAELEARLQAQHAGRSLAEWEEPPRMLLWARANEPALLTQLQEQLKDESGALREAHVVLTCDSEPMDLDEELDFEVTQLEPVELAMGGAEAAMAGKLHQEIRLVAVDSSGTKPGARCLLDDGLSDGLFNAGTIQRAVRDFFCQQRSGTPEWTPDSTVTGIYAENGGCVLRVWVSDVSMLHRLRDTLLNGAFEVKLTESLRRSSRSSEQPAAATSTRDLGYDDGAESTSALSVTLDSTHFAEQYEQLVLELEELTPHQRQKLAETEGHARAHIIAAAGAGKTFLALHQMIKVLCADGAAAQGGLTCQTNSSPNPSPNPNPT